MYFQELDSDQRREKVNSDQRFATLRQAKLRARGYRGSLTWLEVKGETYLVRSYYDASGNRRQTSEGRRDERTEALKAGWEHGRAETTERLKWMQDAVLRQSAVNRAVGLGRVPLVGARIIRAIDDAGLLGNGIRIVGTNAIYAYEAAAGVMVDPGITATLDVDLLMDARRSLRITAEPGISDRTLIGILRRSDRSFERSARPFRAVNRDGYLVDLIKPQRETPWLPERESLGDASDELAAAPIEGLTWLESAPAFEAVAIDEKGGPVRIVATDPRVFAAHKLWVSNRIDREPVKRRRDEAQAQAVARLVTRYLVNLPYEAADMRMLPHKVFDAAEPLFSAAR